MRTLAAATLLLLVPCAMAQPRPAPDRPYQVAIVLSSVPVADVVDPKPEQGVAGRGVAVIVEGLRKLGWIDGKNIRLLWRSAEGDATRFPAIMNELAAMPVDVIVAFGPGIEPAMKATRTIPIVMSTSAGIAIAGMVESLGRPERNVTGISFESPPTLNGKRLELLKRVAPGTASNSS